MRVPFEWLCELASVSAPVDEVARRLTDAGFEVAEIHRAGEHWDRVVVGEVVRIDPHPNADRLNLPTVATGDTELQVVCGAWNFAVGDKIAFAHEGARLWDAYSAEPRLKELQPTKIRGVVSRGMLCSNRELGLSDDHEGILILDADAPVGRPLTEVLGDEVIEFELKANRPDALSVLGIAREAAALFGTQDPLADSRSPRDRRGAVALGGPVHRRSGALRALLGSLRPRRPGVRVAGLASQAAGAGGDAADQHDRGRDELRDAGDGPAAARIRLGHRPRRCHRRPNGQVRRAADDAGRPGPRVDRRDALHRGRRGSGGAGRRDGWLGHRGHRCHLDRAAGIGDVRSREASAARRTG